MVGVGYFVSSLVILLLILVPFRKKLKSIVNELISDKVVRNSRESIMGQDSKFYLDGREVDFKRQVMEDLKEAPLIMQPVKEVKDETKAKKKTKTTKKKTTKKKTYKIK